MGHVDESEYDLFRTSNGKWFHYTVLKVEEDDRRSFGAKVESLEHLKDEQPFLVEHHNLAVDDSVNINRRDWIYYSWEVLPKSF